MTWPGCGGGGASSPTAPATLREGEGVFGEWVASGGVRRTYVVHVPAGADRTRPLPLIVAFHGGGGDPAFGDRSGLHDAAQRRSFIVVSPHGTSGDWALGCNCTQPDRQGIDDLRFFDTLVAHIAANVAVDRNRVYVTGFSNGATFSYRVACERGASVAAVAAVAASPFNESTCRPGHPMPALAFHGSSDPILGFQGGFFGAQGWARLNGCGTTPAETLLPDRADDGSRVRRYAFSGCAAGGEVLFYSLEGAGHTWPGSPVEFGNGSQSRDIDASEEIVAFFARH
jgi:polyhydroxybutyrate depolymerase